MADSMMERQIPADLSVAAVKAARRLQALPTNRTYVITLTKLDKQWLISLLSEEGAKVEIAR